MCTLIYPYTMEMISWRVSNFNAFLVIEIFFLIKEIVEMLKQLLNFIKVLLRALYLQSYFCWSQSHISGLLSTYFYFKWKSRPCIIQDYFNTADFFTKSTYVFSINCDILRKLILSSILLSISYPSYQLSCYMPFYSSITNHEYDRITIRIIQCATYRSNIIVLSICKILVLNDFC